MSEKQQFEQLSLKFSSLQATLNDLINTRQTLETQNQENKIVKTEFENLESDAKVYKLTGPVLLPQDKTEAELNVGKRLEFIKDEIEKIEKKIETTQKEIEQTRDSLLELRSKMTNN